MAYYGLTTTGYSTRDLQLPLFGSLLLLFDFAHIKLFLLLNVFGCSFLLDSIVYWAGLGIGKKLMPIVNIIYCMFSLELL